MAKRKVEKGPSWLEVGLGAVLSVILGTFLGIVYMIARPVATVKEIPKDAPSGAVYFIEGSHGYNKTGGLEEKRKAFLAGESVDVDESEINLLLGDTGPAPAAKAGDKGAPAPAADAKMVDVGSLNARIFTDPKEGGKIQFGTPLNFNVFTVAGTIIIQTNGTFEKHGSGFVYVPDTLLVGGCPVNRIPFATDYVMGKLLFARPVPDDIAAAWSKLVGVSIEGTSLKLRMP
jgi:hypothetical protein